ncbi:3,4-dihydroxy-2-butanone-4-phosphate synthase [Halococcoides cellulosivorans]|uniref:3,4-dihydroxy-2-butanone 4-phosphate synthase n=1 Tax=Halococcoides cellulosivorans TaxID=1679096 RepID=A0A2R4WYG7_9EURY|nr:3,4-dihydroxy-2-butanone-4-phosphate synthase [Halococcoides cellulosivorans]AWB26566.1 3,4-dihydroxy-2-butanone-4-phosphate synthase [Halococcoides cellulosivorans]
MSRPSDRTDADRLDAAIEAFANGDPVLIHDAADREGEVDLVYPAGTVAPSDVARLRTDAGGLICVALSDRVARAFDLPFLADAVEHPATENHVLSYDDRSSFSLTVNHRETETGITDRDRARTITALSDAAADPAGTDFAGTFRSPGHVHLLRGAADGVTERTGHTELALALADAADLPPAVVVCEMLDAATGLARTPADAQAYADREGLVYVEGGTIVDHL